jgi:O-antigen/teichoic acid export membrane protein
LKVIAAAGFGFAWGPVGVVAGISIASIATYILAWQIIRTRRQRYPAIDLWTRAWRYLGVVLPGTVAVSVLLSVDVVVVKHYFAAQAAGEYAVVAALGRAIFWAASGVAAVLFPKVVFRSASSQRAATVVGASLLLVAFAGIVGTALLSVVASPLIRIFAGPAYQAGAAYLPWYAIGMTFLGATAVLVVTFQTTGRPGYLAVLLPLAAVEPIALIALHQSLQQVVLVLDVALALPVIGLAAWYGLDGRVHRPTLNRVAPALVAQADGVTE